MLTKDALEFLRMGQSFKTGIIDNSPDGCFMDQAGGELRWVAVRGYGEFDWCIYVGKTHQTVEEIACHGDKVHDSTYIKRMILCDDEALKYYRY